MAQVIGPLNELCVSHAARLIEQGEITSVQLVRACLDRIAAREPAVKAWAAIDADIAVAQARACDAGPRRGPLHGVPIAVKDVIDTVEYPTGMGSPIYDGYRPKSDASCVAMARRAGAVILGKSVTCEFAGMYRGATTNPHAMAHTPGGSSSGSAAAVADCMVPMAYGTQTGGSIIRPAAFCGIVGFKPSFGTINRAGLKFAAESLDTIGFMARSVADISLILEAHIGASSMRSGGVRKPRIGYCLTYLWDKLGTDETRATLDRVAGVMAARGATVEEVRLPAHFAEVTEARSIIDNVERAHGMAWEYAHHASRISDILRERIAIGVETPLDAYRNARRFLDDARREIDDLLAEFDALLVPAVNGEAPEKLEFTGDPSFQSLWTALHVPAVTLPVGKGAHGLPLAVQLVTQRWRDEHLLDVAKWVEAGIEVARSSDRS